MKLLQVVLLAIGVILLSCDSSNKTEKEQLVYEPSSDGESQEKDTVNSVKRDLPLSALATYPQRVVLTGMPQHRLVSIYKYIPPKKESKLRDYYSYENNSYSPDDYTHYMPGLDLQFGFNMLNLAHYDMKSEKLNYLFERPVLIKSLYYPSYVQDSVGDKPKRKPITRDYFLVSVYDEDTNRDTLLNRHDLRRFYLFNAACDVKTQLLPSDYSVTRSQYDFDNDVMYVYAVHDANGDGKAEQHESLHIFWLSLKSPAPAKRLY